VCWNILVILAPRRLGQKYLKLEASVGYTMRRPCLTKERKGEKKILHHLFEVGMFPYKDTLGLKVDDLNKYEQTEPGLLAEFRVFKMFQYLYYFSQHLI
jgi:hypothetical protein